MNKNVGDEIQIQSYKHDKKLHRIWETATVLDHNDERIIVANKRTKVIESNGRFWYTKEPSVCYFFKERWFNVIGIIKPHGISFYCNISSPFVLDEEAIKYIDYDLDIKVQPDFSYNILDRNEYLRHQDIMDYPKKLKMIIDKELKILEDMICNREEPFAKGFVDYWFSIYKNTI